MKLLILCACVVLAAADVSHIVNSEAQAQILKQEADLGLNGQYAWGYETENGIQASETGVLKNAGSEDAAESVQGGASWISPEGEAVSFQYEADENGYRPQGSHIPTPHPIPEYILRALEYIRTHPPPQQPEN